MRLDVRLAHSALLLSVGTGPPRFAHVSMCSAAPRAPDDTDSQPPVRIDTFGWAIADDVGGSRSRAALDYGGRKPPANWHLALGRTRAMEISDEHKHAVSSMGYSGRVVRVKALEVLKQGRPSASATSSQSFVDEDSAAVAARPSLESRVAKAHDTIDKRAGEEVIDEGESLDKAYEAYAAAKAARVAAEKSAKQLAEQAVAIALKAEDAAAEKVDETLRAIEQQS